MKKYLEQRIPMKSRISNEQRKAWLSDPRARFRLVHERAWSAVSLLGLVTRMWRERRKERA